MTTLTSTYTGKDQNWNQGTTTYWFDLSNGETYGVVEGGESWNSSVVDVDGGPVDEVPQAIERVLVVTQEMRMEK